MTAGQNRTAESRARQLASVQQVFATFESIQDPSRYKSPQLASARKHLAAISVFRNLKEGRFSYAELDPTGQRDGAEIQHKVLDYLYTHEIEDAQKDFKGYAHKSRIIKSGGREIEMSNAASSLGGVDSSLQKAKEFYPSRDTEYTALKLSAYDLRAMENRLLALGEKGLSGEANNDWRKDGVKRYQKFMNSLPAFPIGGAEGLEEKLFALDKNGYAPLDNPRIWQDGDAARWVLDTMPLSDKLLTRKTEKGGTLLLAAFNGMPAEEVVKQVNVQGNQLDKSLLLTGEGKPNFLLRVLMHEGKSDALFCHDNWLGKRGEMTEVYNAMPEEKRPNNYHRLRQELKASEPSGIGR